LQTKISEVQEVKHNLSSTSKRESDTTGEIEKPLTNQQPSEPVPSAASEKPNEKSKDSVINKLKDFFKF